MKKLAIFAIICLLAAPALAWEKFDGKITETTITKDTRPPRDSVGVMWVGEPMEGLELADPVQRFYQEANIRTVMEADPFESVPGIHVYDALGNHVGLLVNFAGAGIQIYVLDAESIITIDARTGDIKTGALLYTSDDCTGQPYVYASTMYFVTKACDIFYTGQRVAPVFARMNSKLEINNDMCSCVGSGAETFFAPAVVVPAADLGLYLPMSLPFRFQAMNLTID